VSSIAETSTSDFDLGPLTWVKAEIDQSLAKGLAALQSFAEHPDQPTHLKHAQTHVHQAAGAVQIVGLDGAITLLEEVERHMALLETVAEGSVPDHVEAIGAACRRLTRYLNELTEGEPPITLKLYPEYEALARLRGSESVSPTDLFYPDLTRRPPRGPERVGGTLAGPELAMFMRTQRRIYQQGLLSWLRGDAQGLAAMQRAVRAIEDALAGTPTGSFWWSVGGFLASAASEGILPSYTVKQLCARIDLQIRRFVEGATKVADRLRREVLYHIAISEPTTDRVREVQALYDLPQMLPKKVEARQIDFDRYQPLLRRAQELITSIKDNWLKVAGGRREMLAPIAQHLGELKNLTTGLHEPALVDLIAALETVAVGATKTGSVSDIVAMEFATGLLLGEDAVTHFARLSDQFPKQVEAMKRRLDFAQRGVLSLPAAEEDLLDETARRAQERMLLAQVAREIQGNLRHIEKVLDAFFRDSSERGDLPGLAAYTRQIQGALQILGLTEADELLLWCQQQIDAYAEGAAVNRDDLEVLAESLSGLGFYIEAVEQQRPDAARLLDPFMRSKLGLESAPAAEPPPQSLEAAVAASRENLPDVISRFRAAPHEPARRHELANLLHALKQDADLVADAAFADAATESLAALDDPRQSLDDVFACLDRLVGQPPAEAPAPSAETIRLLDVGAEKLDAELSDIFLTEAAEVLATIAENREACEADAGDREALRSIRRGFHTLKGSGRMVGLLELGESAYTVEKLLNRWLEEERPAIPELLAVIAAAEEDFKRWVGELQSSGVMHVDDVALKQVVAEFDASYPAPGSPHAAPAVDEFAGVPAEDAETAIEPIEEQPLPEAVESIGLAPSPPEEIAADAATAVPEVAMSPPAAEIEAPVGAPLVAASEPVGAVEPARPVEPADLVPVAAAPAAGFGLRHFAAEPRVDRPLTHADPVDSIRVGEVPISEALYRILLEETAQLLDSLRREHSVLEFDPSSQPSDEMVRAAHTLAGIHRTAGFPPVADVAHALESALLTLQHPGYRHDSTLAVLGDAAQTIAELVDFIGMRQAFGQAALEHGRLACLRLAALQETSGGLTADSETLAARAALADEAIAAPPATAPEAAEAAAVAHGVPAIGSESTAAGGGAAIPELIDGGALLPVGDPLASVRDELDAQLLPVFLEEAHELFPRAGGLLRDWRRAPADQDHARELRRTLHTLKGSARMAGAMRLGELTHLMESRLLVGDREVAPSADLFEALDVDLDRLASLLDELQSKPATEAPAAPAELTATVAAEAPRAAATAEEPGEGELVQRATVRVRADIIDRLVNESGEVSIARARIEGELRALKANLLELTNSVIRLRGQVREIEIQAETQIQSRMSQVQEAEGFDPLEFDRYTRFQELSRGLAEGVNDVATVQQALLKNLDDADAALVAQARLSRDVQQQLLAVRTVPFASMSERLYRLLRQTAKELDKKANLEIRGGQTELDRGVLEKLVAPLEHLLRNALDHGLESRAARVAAGKPEIGEIAITVRQEGNEIALLLSDDGPGLPLDRIQDKAMAAGMFPPGVQPTQAQLVEAIFAPGFTTAAEVTQISGRGIGMDVVKNAITGLGGRLEVATTAGRGTTFTLYLPLTLAVNQAVLIRAAGRIYALPAVLVEQVQQVKVDALGKIYASKEVRWQTRHYPFFYLPQLLGDDRPQAELQRYNPVLLLKSANQFVAVHVDEMLGNQEIVIKNIGVQLARLPGLAGATVLGTGEIVLILNPVQLAARHLQPQPAAGLDRTGLSVVAEDGTIAPASPPAVPARTPYVLVVDDSLTVRKITSRLLTREGYEAGTARDGVDALQVLADRRPDVILLDIEMPRMDGFEFAKTVKADPKLRNIPIIMITSRTAPKHRARAAEIGVEVYLGKPYQEEELLRQIRQAVSGRLVPAAAVAD
jgi:chemosensory pili system protein ChpA (sensor histidine kinase/response regulator)